MTVRDSRELADHIRRQERVAKEMVAVRAAELIADFEAQMSRIYAWDDEEVWAEAKKSADAVMVLANEAIAARCRELGIPPAYAPRLNHYWAGRWENADPSRRVELRRTALSRIDALAKQAKVQISARSVEIQRDLLSGRLTTEAGQAFLAAMPTAEALMPALNVRAMLPSDLAARLQIVSIADGDED